ncbi:MAG TPA: ParB/RepB/Spo0J family partition protein [bacterium]|nr:ParB/RepB/Spo0J family partition protein [bacterium]
MMKRGLGRGLGALIPGVADQDQPSGPTAEIDISTLSPNPYQPRREVSGEAFDELVASVRRHGILQPIIVRRSGSGYEIVAGERRWKAAQAAGITTIPAVVRDLPDREMLELALIENLRREDLDPIERATAYRRLGEEFAMTQEQIAEVVGGSRPAVTNSLRLLELPSEIQSAISADRISEGHGRALLMIQSTGAMLDTWRIIEEKGLSVRETEDLAKAWVRNVSRETRRRGPRKPNPQLVDLSMQLGERYSTKASIVPIGKKGTIQLSYYSDTDLERLIDILLR